MRTVALAATLLGLLPLAWLALRRRKARSAWWWMAAGFGVSTLADLAGAAGFAPLASQVYPVSQAALMAVPMLPRRTWVGYVALLLAVAAASVVWRGGLGFDVALRVVAFGGVAGLAWRYAVPSALRTALLVYFGGGLLLWLCYVAVARPMGNAPIHPLAIWFAYIGMQAVRVVGLGLWCYAASREA